MVAYSFKKQFAPRILDGTKIGTIRADRKRHARPGEELQLYVGMRTRQCRLVTRKTCRAVHPVEIEVTSLGISAIRVDGTEIDDLERFARGDGFDDSAAMGAFWRDVHEPGLFIGVWIRWADEPVETRTCTTCHHVDECWNALWADAMQPLGCVSQSKWEAQA